MQEDPLSKQIHAKLNTIKYYKINLGPIILLVFVIFVFDICEYDLVEF